MKKQKHGIALFLVLLVTGLVVMLIGAFFGVNQASLSLLGASTKQHEAMLAAQSGVDYAYFRLERDQSWCTTAANATWSDADGPSPGTMTLSETVDSITGIGRCVGNISTNQGMTDQQSFVMEVYNNLDNHTGAKSFSGLPVQVQANTCIVNCHGLSGGFQVNLQICFQGDPAYDASITSNGPLDMHGTKNWQVASADNVRNWVRSNSDIYAPDVLADPPGSYRVEIAPASASGFPGVLWSKRDVYSGSTNLVGAADMSKMQIRTGVPGHPALITTKANLNNEIYKLNVSDLAMNTTAGNCVIPGGIYKLGSAAVTYSYDWDIPGTNTTPGDSGSGSHAVLHHTLMAGNGTVYYLPADHPAPHEGNISNESYNEGALGTSAPGGKVRLGSTADDAFYFDINTGKFHSDGSRPIQVDGPFTIATDEKSDTHAPALIFNNDASRPGMLFAAGDITLMGTVTGAACIASQHNVRIPSESHIDLNSPGIALYGANVTLDAIGSTNAAFQGLVYAAQDFIINTNSTLGVINIRGALVAQNGSIKIPQANTVNMTYDPQYLQIYTNAAYKLNIQRGGVSYMNTRRIRMTSWRHLLDFGEPGVVGSHPERSLYAREMSGL